MKSDDEQTEHTGRWTMQEHSRFLEGLQRYGKNWRAIARLVSTRTANQARSHAQKYFLKAEKGGTLLCEIANEAQLEKISPTSACYYDSNERCGIDVGVQYGEGMLFYPKIDMKSLLACIPIKIDLSPPYCS